MAKSNGASGSSNRTLRCAIYTRKSSEEGLEQDFNSLHAQREACEAYIKSQRHEGWVMIETAYDDGGFSGGNLERPGLTRLLGDIHAGQIDIVVVYKVDRLTRALTDFARIIERFDAHHVSFVSVTQQFNTTSSMGRLTLNVLLSFAQFEREVTGERIRDKISASKQKGMWMGGAIPLGYDVHGRTLTINEPEAEIVRTIFQLYVELGTVTQVKAEIDRRGVTSKAWMPQSGKAKGGKSLSRGYLYRLLGNPLYRGQIRHRDIVHEGQHPAIIDLPIWEAVQQQLKNNTRERAVRSNATEASPLAGLLVNEQGVTLIADHANKLGKRYRYYVDRKAASNTEPSGKSMNKSNGLSLKKGWRIPAPGIEQIVLQSLRNLFTDPGQMMNLFARQFGNDCESYLSRAKDLGERLIQRSTIDQRKILLNLIDRVALGEANLTLWLRPSGLIATLSDTDVIEDKAVDDDTVALTVPWKIRRRGVEMKLAIHDACHPPARALDTALIRAIAKGHLWLHQLTSGQYTSLVEIARHNQIGPRRVSLLLNLACLAPDIVERIMEGTQPSHLTLQRLIVHETLPADWQAQRDLLLD